MMKENYTITLSVSPLSLCIQESVEKRLLKVITRCCLVEGGGRIEIISIQEMTGVNHP
jgi:hypothetical protein